MPVGTCCGLWHLHGNIPQAKLNFGHPNANVPFGTRCGLGHINVNTPQAYRNPPQDFYYKDNEIKRQHKTTKNIVVLGSLGGWGLGCLDMPIFLSGPAVDWDISMSILLKQSDTLVSKKHACRDLLWTVTSTCQYTSSKMKLWTSKCQCSFRDPLWTGTSKCQHSSDI